MQMVLRTLNLSLWLWFSGRLSEALTVQAVGATHGVFAAYPAPARCC